MAEILKKVPIKGAYYANDSGTIYNLNSEGLVPCKTFINKRGYLQLDLSHGEFKTVHRLVAMAFHGSAVGKEVDHINMDKLDNRPVNLQILSKTLHERKTRCRGKKKGFNQYKNTLTLLDKAEIRYYVLKRVPVEIIIDQMMLAEYLIRSVIYDLKDIPRNELKRLVAADIKRYNNWAAEMSIKARSARKMLNTLTSY